MARKAEVLEHIEEAATVMTRDHLEYRKDLQAGGKILGGQGTLVRMPELEGIEFFVLPSSDLVVPNPGQPRNYFDPVKMEELENTIRKEGQKTAIAVVPFYDGRRIRLFIIDGERRLRVLRDRIKSPYARITVKWTPDQRTILKTSLILNESFAPHNPMERARAYETLIQYAQEAGEKHPIADLAKDLGLSEQTIRNHLKLLTLPPKIQEMVAKRTLPRGNALFLAQAQKQFGDSLGFMRLARVLVDDPDWDLTEGGKEVRLTRDAMRGELERLLVEGGQGEEAARLQMQKTVLTFIGNLSRVSSGGRKITGEKFERVVIETFRNRGRGEPPEVVRDTLDAVSGLLGRIRVLVDKAIAPDPLPEVPGRPKFAQYLEKLKLHFGDMRYHMAVLFANASDNGGQILTVGKLCEQLSISTQDAGNNMIYLSRELGKVGIDLEKHWVREKARDGDYEEKPAYRLAWAKEGYVADPSRLRPAAKPAEPLRPPVASSAVVTSVRISRDAPVPPPVRPAPATALSAPPRSMSTSVPTIPLTIPQAPPPPVARPKSAPAVVAPPPEVPKGPRPRFIDFLATPLARETFKKNQTELVCIIALADATDHDRALTPEQILEASGTVKKSDLTDIMSHATDLLRKIGASITRVLPKGQERSGYQLTWKGDPVETMVAAQQKPAGKEPSASKEPVAVSTNSSFEIDVEPDGQTKDVVRRLRLACTHIANLVVKEMPTAGFVPGTDFGNGLRFHIMRRGTDGAVLVRSNFAGPNGNFSSLEETYRSKFRQIIGAQLGVDPDRVTVLCFNAGLAKK